MITQLVNWFRRKKLESGLERELRYHLDRRITDLEKSGLPTAEARRQALLELGGIAQIQEEVRDIWLTRWLGDFTYRASQPKAGEPNFWPSNLLAATGAGRSGTLLPCTVSSSLWNDTATT